jgi:ribulose-bisphosphate carboxylase large chain
MWSLARLISAKGRAMVLPATASVGTGRYVPLSPRIAAGGRGSGGDGSTGGIDYIKDDHASLTRLIAFERRVEAVTQAGKGTNQIAAWRCTAELSGDLDTSAARSLLPALKLLLSRRVDARGMGELPSWLGGPRRCLFAHPSMAGAARIAPPLLLGKLFRLIGADATVFPNYGGRFGYSPDTCRALAREALRRCKGLQPCVPVPAGGMTTARVPEMLAFYGADVMLLIGGALLEARAQLTEVTAAFVAEVHRYAYDAQSADN